MQEKLSYKALKELREALGSQLSAFLYLSRVENRIIVVPHFQGIFPTEQNKAAVITFDEGPEKIGEVLLEALLDFKKQDLHQTDMHVNAALIASELDDITKFDRKYNFFRISTTPPNPIQSNLCLEIRGYPNRTWNRTLCVEDLIGISPNMAAAKISIGKLVLKIFKACEHLDKEKY